MGSFPEIQGKTPAFEHSVFTLEAFLYPLLVIQVNNKFQRKGEQMTTRRLWIMLVLAIAAIAFLAYRYLEVRHFGLFDWIVVGAIVLLGFRLLRALQKRT